MRTLKLPPRFNFFEILRNPNRFLKNRTDILYDATLKHGNVVKLPHPFENLYVASHPDAIKHICIDKSPQYKKSAEYQILARWIGNGLIISEGESWLASRRLLQPGFQRSTIDQLKLQVESSVQAMINSWSERIEKGATDSLPLDVGHEMIQLTMGIMGRMLFGVSIDEDLNEMAKLMEECQAYVTKRMLTVDWDKFFPTIAGSKFKVSRRRLIQLSQKYIEISKPGSLVHLMKAHRHSDGSTLEDKEIIDQVLGFFVAGHETSAVGLSWAFLLLSENPSVQSKFIAQQDAASAYNYAQQIFSESLRLYPPVPCFARTTTEDDQLMGYSIPKNSTIVIPQFVTHRRPDLWQRPLVFDPDRFSPLNRHTIVKYSYFPYGVGPRSCIGHELGQIEGATTIRAVLTNFKVDEVVGARPQMNAQLSLRFDRSLIVSIKKR